MFGKKNKLETPSVEANKPTSVEPLDFNTVWARFKANSPLAEIENAFNALAEASRAAGTEAMAAGKAYFASAEAKKQKVDNSISKLNKKVALTQARINKLKYPLTAATADGDDEALEQIRGEIKDLELGKAQCLSESELLQSAFIQGDEALYLAAKEAQDRFLKAKYAVIDAARAIDGFGLEKWIQPLLSAASSFHSEYSSGASLGVGVDMDRLEDHYRAEAVDKRRKEEQEMKKATMLEDANRPLVKITHKTDPRETERQALREREIKDRRFRGVRTE